MDARSSLATSDFLAKPSHLYKGQYTVEAGPIEMAASQRAVALLIALSLVILIVSIVTRKRGENHSLSDIKKELGRDTNK